METNAMLIKKAGKPAGPGLEARRGLRLEIAVPVFWENQSKYNTIQNNTDTKHHRKKNNNKQI